MAEGLTTKGQHEGIWGGWLMKFFYIFIMVVVTQLFVFAKTHRTIHEKGYILLFVKHTHTSSFIYTYLYICVYHNAGRSYLRLL